MTDIKTVIYQWIIASGEKAIWANQNAPIPKGDFLTLNLTSIVPVIPVYTLSPNDLGIATLVGHNECTLTVQAFGKDSIGRLQKVHLCAYKQSSRAILYTARISFIDVQAITDLTSLIADEYEPRAQINIRLRFPIDTTDDVGFITHVTGQGGLYNNAAAIPPKEVTNPPVIEPDWDISLVVPETKK